MRHLVGVARLTSAPVVRIDIICQTSFLHHSLYDRLRRWHRKDIVCIVARTRTAVVLLREVVVECYEEDEANDDIAREL